MLHHTAYPFLDEHVTRTAYPFLDRNAPHFTSYGISVLDEDIPRVTSYEISVYRWRCSFCYIIRDIRFR